MSLKGSALLHNTNCILRYAQDPSLLPFLYQTRTLQRLREKQCKPISSNGNAQSCKAFSTGAYFRAVSDNIPFEESGTRASVRRVSSQPPRMRRVEVGPSQTPLPETVEDPLPASRNLREILFPPALPDIFDELPPTPRKPRESTITASEQAVFSRIFADLAAKDIPNAAVEDDSVDDELEANSDPDAYLDRIFEAAIGRSHSNLSDLAVEAEDGSSKRTGRSYRGPATTFVDSLSLVEDGIISRYPLPLREAAARATEARLKARGHVYPTEGLQRGLDEEFADKTEHLEDLSEYERKVYRARKDDRRKVGNMLDRAETDVEIWRVLEGEVFSVVVKLQEQLKAEEERKKRATKQAAKWKKRKGVIDSEVDAEVPERKVRSEIDMVDEQPVPLLAILETNYAAHCLFALRLLRKHFRTSPYAMFLLQKIKSLGPVSYVLGTSTELYNELMFIKWKEYRDLHGISELGTEMRDRGLAVDQMTLEVLRAVLLMSKQGAKGKQGEVVRAWWGLQGSVAGVAKVSGLYGRLWSDFLEKRRQAGPGRGGIWEIDQGGLEESRRATLSG